MFAGPPGTALLTSRSADGVVVPMPMLPLLATMNREALPVMKLIGARPRGDVVDPVFVGAVVEALELRQRARWS